MELRVELRLSFFLFYIGRSLLWARLLRENRWWHPPLDVFIRILTSLVFLILFVIIKTTTVRSTRRSSKRPTCRKSSPRRPSLRPPPPRCSHRYVSFFFALLVLFKKGVVLNNGDKKTLRAFEEEEEEVLSLSLLTSSLYRARALKVSRGTPPPLPFDERPRGKKKKRWDDERDLSAIRDERRREGKSLKIVSLL